MKITHKQFEVLILLEKEKRKLSQREISLHTNFSLGTINNIISELIKAELIDNQNEITEKGIEVLNPYKVKKAIFLAAGFGSRLVPITLNTPKPLIKVNGTRMIETLLDAVVEAGIEEIYIVRGYLGEQFEILLQKYPNIKFIDNYLFNEANNISSAYMVRELLENAYVFESDLILSKKSLIRKYEYHSNFLGIPVDITDDWCVETKNGIIVKEKVGGVNCHRLIGISYYSKEDGAKLKKDIEEIFSSPGGKEKYWEQVQLVEKKNNYKIHIRECKKDEIIEIDTFNELKKIDRAYEIQY